MMYILAGDIGGTHTRLRLLQATDAGLGIRRETRYASRDHASLAAALRKFLSAEPVPVTAACFGIAGPVRTSANGQSVRVTNLPWEIDGRALGREFDIAAVRLINDFQAVGYGIEALDTAELVTLQPGEPLLHQPRAVIGAGTGLGQGILVWQNTHYEAIATEGGHVDFAATSPLEFELAQQLRAELGRACYEDVLSGPGLVRLYRFLRGRGAHRESDALARAMTEEDPAAAITRAAVEQGDPLATETLDLFLRIYGAQAGNLALAVGATGGVYVAGGIAPRMVARLNRGAFLAAFRDKGNMARFVDAVPLHVVIAQDVGLRGAAQVARRVATAAHRQS